MTYLNCVPFLILFIRKFAVLFVFIFPMPLTSQCWCCVTSIYIIENQISIKNVVSRKKRKSMNLKADSSI
jgi:hypothetical protein